MTTLQTAWRRVTQERTWQMAGICAIVILLAAVLGRRPSLVYLLVPAAIAGGLVLLRWPILGLPILIIASFWVPIEVGTGTEVSLNITSLLIPALLGIWIMIALVHQRAALVPSRVNTPLVVFLAFGIISIIISNLTWDPNVPKSDRFIVVQLAQWALFAFSAGIFWIMGNWVKDEKWLRLLVFWFIFMGGVVALLKVTPAGEKFLFDYGTITHNRAPFWMLLAALTTGQLLYNRQLALRWQILLVLVLGAVFYFAFAQQQDRSSNWVGVACAVGTVALLRFRNLRRMTLVILVALAASGMLFRILYEFAGGDAKWEESGASRGVLIQRVIDLSMRNPITGIGPAAYRPYGMTQPLSYEGAYWVDPRLNTHNNYVDLFSQLGIVGVAIFFWFIGELAWLLWKLQKRFDTGFLGGYASSMAGMLIGALALMALADWFLPFVYNIGFPGFQISSLIWMFLGGALVLEQMARAQDAAPEQNAPRKPAIVIPSLQ
jgi:O-antigen ligase